MYLCVCACVCVCSRVSRLDSGENEASDLGLDRKRESYTRDSGFEQSAWISRVLQSWRSWCLSCVCVCVCLRVCVLLALCVCCVCVAQDGSRFEPVDTFVKIRFHTKQTGHGAFRSSDFEFITAPEYRTIYPSWHLNLASSFPTAQTIWTALFQIDVLARKSVKDEDSFETNYAGQARGILAESALNSASNRATPSSLLHDANNTEGVQSIVQVNPHTEAADEEFVNEEGLSHLVDPSTEVDMSKLIFLPSPKWPEIVQHAQTNTLLFLLDDGGGRERWCESQPFPFFAHFFQEVVKCFFHPEKLFS